MSERLATLRDSIKAAIQEISADESLVAKTDRCVVVSACDLPRRPAPVQSQPRRPLGLAPTGVLLPIRAGAQDAPRNPTPHPHLTPPPPRHRELIKELSTLTSDLSKKLGGGATQVVVDAKMLKEIASIVDNKLITEFKKRDVEMSKMKTTFDELCDQVDTASMRSRMSGTETRSANSSYK